MLYVFRSNCNKLLRSRDTLSYTYCMFSNKTPEMASWSFLLGPRVDTPISLKSLSVMVRNVVKSTWNTHTHTPYCKLSSGIHSPWASQMFFCVSWSLPPSLPFLLLLKPLDSFLGTSVGGEEKNRWWKKEGWCEKVCMLYMYDKMVSSDTYQVKHLPGMCMH